MDIWREIQQLLLMGAGAGGTPSQALREFMRSHLPAERLGEGQPLAQQLLDAAAAFALLRKTAAVHSLPSDAYEPMPMPPSDTQPLPADLLERLSLLLRSGDEELIEEFALRFDHERYPLPESLLPAWLDWGLHKSMRPLQSQFAAIAGTRGAWLATHNPQWAYALSVQDEEAFAYASAPLRLRYLRQLRAQQPSEAARLIEANYAQEQAEQLVEWLQLLAQQPQESEIPLLQRLSQDRRRTVRRAAFALLSLHTQSEQSQRLRGIAAKNVRLDAQLNWLVDLPEEATDALRSVGIEEKIHTIEGGEKASFLRQLLEMLPPSIWYKNAKIQPLDLLHSARKSEWAVAIIGGLLAAAQRFADGEMLIALHRFYLLTPNAKFWNAVGTDFLGQCLNSEQANSIAKIYADDAANNFNDSHPIIRLAMQLKNWSETAGKALLQLLIDGSGEEKKQQHYYGLRALVQRAAYCLPHTLAPYAAQAWEGVRAERPSNWQKDFARLLNLLQRRHQLAPYFRPQFNISAIS